MDSGYSKTIKQNLLKLYEEVGTEVFGNSRVAEVLGCSGVKATTYLKRMEAELEIVAQLKGLGKGKYRFSLKWSDMKQGRMYVAKEAFKKVHGRYR